MPIPEFDAKGFLPAGVHKCTFDELASRFGTFQARDRRPMLLARFRELFTELQRSQLFAAVIVNGSFVTRKAIPDDIDLLLVLKPGHIWQADLGPADYALLSRQRLHRRFAFDVSLQKTVRRCMKDMCAFMADRVKILTRQKAY